MTGKALKSRLTENLHALLQQTAELEKLPRDDQNIHKLRQSIKQLRAALRLYRDSNNRDALTRLDRALSATARQFTAARENRVARRWLENLPGKNQDMLALLEPGIRACTELLESDQHALAAAPPTSTEFHQLLQVPLMPEQPPGLRILRRNLRQSYRKSRQLLHSASEQQREEPANTLHRARKWVKYLHYQLQLLGLQKGAHADFHKRLVMLGTELGRYHDLLQIQQLLLRLMKQYEDEQELADSLHRLLRLTEEESEICLDKCRKLAKKIFASKPKDFTEKLLKR